MKKGILITLLSALAGGLTAYAVVNETVLENVTADQQISADGSLFRTVNLSHDNWPDFTYAAESAVDAVVYVKVVSTQTMPQAPSSIFDFFFGLPQQTFVGGFVFQKLAADADPLVFIDVFFFFYPVEHQHLIAPGNIAKCGLEHDFLLMI